MAAAPSPEQQQTLKEKVQAIINADHKGGWEQAWQNQLTPWDLGGVTPAVSALIKAGGIPEDAQSVLVPGCGAGYDVVAFSEGGKRRAVGLDLSETALSKARERAQGKPGAELASYITGDFFEFQPEEPFDVIFDYTFFCAIDPKLRQEWARKTASLLSPNGRLFTLVFPIGDHEGGPPYAVSKKAYEDLLRPLGFLPEDIPTVSHPARAGKEQLVMWTRTQAEGKM